MSSRVAAKVVAGSTVAFIVLFSFHKKAIESSSTVGLSAEVTLALLILLSFGLGYLLIDFIIWLAKKIHTRWKSYRSKANNRQQREKQIKSLQDACLQVLPHLAFEQRYILSNIKDNPLNLDSSSTCIRILQDYGFIELIHKTDPPNALYKVNPAVEAVIKSYFVEQRRNNLIFHLTQKISEDEKEFLRFFAIPNPSDPNQPQHPYLEARLYRAAQALITKQILIKETDNTSDRRYEQLRLMSDAIALVKEHIVKGTVQRSSLVLDLKNIAASGAGGGGATASRRP